MRAQSCEDSAATASTHSLGVHLASLGEVAADASPARPLRQRPRACVHRGRAGAAEPTRGGSRHLQEGACGARSVLEHPSPGAAGTTAAEAAADPPGGGLGLTARPIQLSGGVSRQGCGGSLRQRCGFGAHDQRAQQRARQSDDSRRALPCHQQARSLSLERACGRRRQWGGRTERNTGGHVAGLEVERVSIRGGAPVVGHLGGCTCARITGGFRVWRTELP